MRGADRSVTVRDVADRSGVAVEQTSGANRSGTLADRTVMGHAKIRFGNRSGTRTIAIAIWA